MKAISGGRCDEGGSKSLVKQFCATGGGSRAKKRSFKRCKHTYKLPIYSRISKKRLNKAEYEAFLRNDREIVYQYGLDRVLLQKNNVEILEEPAYVLRNGGEDTERDVIRFRNPYHLRIRYDRLIAECLKISRSEAKRVLENGVLSVEVVP